jgi:hypothetical protein
MNYINTTTLEYPVSAESLVERFPGLILLPNGVSPLLEGYELVAGVDTPEFDPLTHLAQEGSPVKLNGVWTQTWWILPLPSVAVREAATEVVARMFARLEAKRLRSAAVAAIKVTTAAGNTFDGNEVSQGRMVRAIVALQASGAGSASWVLANNTEIAASVAELTEALILARQAQSDMWPLAC